MPKPEWFKLDAGMPYLLGSRCASCGAAYFPPQLLRCRNPACETSSLDSARLSNVGVLWSYTTLYEKPPPPFAMEGQYSPLCVVAVELPAERITVLGHLATSVSASLLRVGMQMRLCLDGPDTTTGSDYRCVRWRPEENFSGN